MIDLDALKAELEQQATNIDGNVMIEVAVVHSIIARHVAPVVTPEPDAGDDLADLIHETVDRVTPEPDAEVRDVLVLSVGKHVSTLQRAQAITDAGLAALRAHGFAVVRVEDVEAVTRYLDSQRDIWDERASRACDSLEEAIR